LIQQAQHLVGALTGKESAAMSIFPTKILLASDGSEEAELARTTAVDMATTSSKLHVVTVASGYPPYDGYLSQDVSIPKVVEQLRKRAEIILDEQVAKIERDGARSRKSA